MTGKLWQGKVLRALLKLPSITALRVHRGEVIGDAKWPAILDRATWEAVRDVIDSNRDARVGGPPRSYLLSGGILCCGICDEALRSRPAGQVRSYLCVNDDPTGMTKSGCGGVKIKAEPVEDFVIETVFAAIDGGALTKLRDAEVADDEERRQLVEDLRDAERRLAQAEERYLLGDVSRRAYLAVRERLTGETDALRRQLACSQAEVFQEDLPAAPDELRAWFEDAAIDRKRAFLRLFVERVHVKKASRHGAPFSRERIDIAWIV